MAWAKYAAKRLAQAVPALFGLSVLTFLLLRLTPGDPAAEIAGARATPEAVAAVRHQLGLDKGVAEQYVAWIGNAFRGDLGMNVRQTRPVSEIVSSALPATMWIVGLGLVLTVLIGVALGALSAWRPGGVLDWVSKAYATVGVALPAFWAGLLLILLVALPTGLFPTSGWPSAGSPQEKFSAAFLPALALAITSAPVVVRGLRSAVLDIKSSNYLESAHAIGLSPLRTVQWYFLRNAAVTAVPLVAITMIYFVGSSVVVETAFGVSGLGNALVNAVTTRDYGVVQGVVLLIGVFVILIQVVADLAVAALDPRVKLS